MNGYMKWRLRRPACVRVHSAYVRAFMYLCAIPSLLRPSMTLALFRQRKRGRRCFSGTSPSPQRLDGSGPSPAAALHNTRWPLRGPPTAARAMLRMWTTSALGTV